MKILFLFFFSLISLLSHAQNTLNVNLKDGTKVSYAFADKPKITFTEGKLIVTTTRTSAEFPLSGIRKYTFRETESTTKIDEMKASNLQSEYLSVYDNNGKLLMKTRVSDGNASLSLGTLPQGIYIVREGSKSYKIIKH